MMIKNRFLSRTFFLVIMLVIGMLVIADESYETPPEDKDIKTEGHNPGPPYSGPPCQNFIISRGKPYVERTGLTSDYTNPFVYRLDTRSGQTWLHASILNTWFVINEGSVPPELGQCGRYVISRGNYHVFETTGLLTDSHFPMVYRLDTQTGQAWIYGHIPNTWIAIL